jgi:hypothetical protein
MVRLLPLLLAALLANCSQPRIDARRRRGPADFEKLTDDFMYGVLALSPASATQAGYHEHNGMSLDETLDDYSAAGIDAQRRFYRAMQDRVEGIDVAALDREQQADLQIITNNIGLAMLDLDTIQAYRHNPTVYVELAGNALYSPFILNYAPAERRFQHIIRRLEKVPALFEQAKANLLDAPEVWNRVGARGERGKHRSESRTTLRDAVPGPQKPQYEDAADKAISPRWRTSTGFPRRHTVEEDQRLAPRQGRLRTQVPIRAGHRRGARTPARRGGGRSPSHPGGDGQARDFRNRSSRRSTRSRGSMRRRRPTWRKRRGRSPMRRRSCATRGS